ncbi:Glycosyl transferase, family 1 [Metarhizium rileyi]|uniref:Glycosyl transferase, family 1 n=1 Tax=Metarhizium rileyi (strain RCEF 4871) TaxID=1649241 RepID=A0A167G347_METRR|nr:Glycosyl transferase, family 1 [Metarhizium rileyi RCEF 4871]
MTPAKLAGGSSPHREHDLSQFPTFLKGKRILLCTESFGPVNGVSRTTLMLVSHLRNHGAQVAVVAPHNHTNHNTFSPPPSPNLTPADKQPDIRVTGYPLPFNPELSIVYPVRNSSLYSRTFGDDCPPDLVYLASPASLGFQIMLQLRQQPREKQIPVICNFQTDLSGYCAILFPSPLSHIAVFAFDAVQSYLFRHSSIKTVFYPSRFVRRYLVNNRVQPGKLELLTRGVDTNMFNPKRRSNELHKKLAPHGEVIFVTVSRIAGEKGFDFLAKAAKEFDARGLSFELYIVGGNRNPDVEKEVQELFDPLREQGKVIFAGFEVGENLAAAYASGDIFLHCSVTETFVGHGDNGFLIAPSDLHAFVTKAAELADDHALRKRMGVPAREAACRATWDKINNKVAWRMADTIIQQREHEKGGQLSQDPAPSHTGRHVVPVSGLPMMNNALRETMSRSIIDARLIGGLGIILTFWTVTGCYVLFTECLMMRAKGIMSTGDRRVSSPI